MESNRSNIERVVKENSLNIRFYEEDDVNYLEKWITDSEMMFQYAGPGFNYPITAEQISSYQKKNPERQFYMGLYEGKEVAFGEIIPQDPEKELMPWERILKAASNSVVILLQSEVNSVSLISSNF